MKLAWLLVWAWSGVAHAGTYAVVVGVNQSLAGEPALEFADDDAIRYAELFGALGFETALHVAADKPTSRLRGGSLATARPPTLPALIESLDQLEQRAASDSPSQLVFVFVGHGSLDAEGRTFLSLLDRPWTRDDLITQVLERSGFDLVHVIIDACHALNLVVGRGEHEETESFEDKLLTGVLAGYPNAGVLLSTAAGEKAFEWSRIQAGVFSHALRSAMLGAADIDGDRRVSYGETHAFIVAAFDGIDDPRFRQTVFVRPPLQSPLAPLAELDEVDSWLPITWSGRTILSDDHGVVAAAHRPPTYSIGLPTTGPYYVEVDGETQRVTASGLEEITESTSSRGIPADAIHRGLFATPYDASFYRAFAAMADYPMLPVDAPRRVESRPGFGPVRLQVELGGGNRLLRGSGVALLAELHGGFRFHEHATALVGVSAETHHAENLLFEPRTTMVAVPVGLELDWAVAGWRPFVRLAGGYAWVQTSASGAGASLNATEPAGWHARLGAGATLPLGEHWRTGIMVDARLVSVRMDGERDQVLGVGGRIVAAWLP